jgi:hypothetical protein
MHAMTLNVDDSVYDTFKGLLGLLPKDKVSLVEDERLKEPNKDSKEIFLEVREGRNVEEFDLKELKR